VGDKSKPGKGSKHEAKAAQRGAAALPQTRAELLDLHRETRARRNGAPHGSAEHVEAIELIGRIEIEIARIERAVDPPLV
jgi:hypothetical protein